jgi:hypothetical protein
MWANWVLKNRLQGCDSVLYEFLFLLGCHLATCLVYSADRTDAWRKGGTQVENLEFSTVFRDVLSTPVISHTFRDKFDVTSAVASQVGELQQ